MKRYTQPTIEIITNVLTADPIAASLDTVKGNDYFRWGNGNDSYGNNLWVNEGQTSSLDMGGDDNGTIDSRAKGAILWDD